MKLDSKNKFNGGVELEEEYGVNLYSTFYRQYDPQIGRFSGVDVLSESTMGLSTYQFGNNNPATYNDPSGAKFSPNNYGGHRPLFWGLTHSREIRDGLNMDDVEDMQNGWTSAFFNSGFGNGGGGGGGGGAPTGQGYYFSGAAAQNVFIAFRNAYNNSNSDGKWSFSVGMNNNGDVGYWQLNAIAGAGASGETMAEIRLQREFVSLGDYFDGSKNNPYNGPNILLATYFHYQFGGGKPFHVSTDALDFRNISKADFIYDKNGNISINFFKLSNINQTGLALGKVSLTDEGNNWYTINPDRYDFDMQRNNLIRNVLTGVDWFLHNGLVSAILGGPYTIYFHNPVYINPNPIPLTPPN